eukprot:4087255-Amphidinium_carterae.1
MHALPFRATSSASSFNTATLAMRMPMIPVVPGSKLLGRLSSIQRVCLKDDTPKQLHRKSFSSWTVTTDESVCLIIYSSWGLT